MRQPRSAQHAQDVALHAEVVGHHMEFRMLGLRVADAQLPLALRPGIGFRAADFPGQIHALKAGKIARRFERRRLIRAGRDAAVLRALLAQDARQLARIDPGDRHDIVGFQVIRQRLRAAEVAHRHRKIAYHQTAGKHLTRFHILGIHADVADMRACQRDDLLAVGRVGEDFLVTGHRGVEHHLADAAARSPDGNAAKHRTIG